MKSIQRSVHGAFALLAAATAVRAQEPVHWYTFDQALRAGWDFSLEARLRVLRVEKANGQAALIQRANQRTVDATLTGRVYPILSQDISGWTEVPTGVARDRARLLLSGTYPLRDAGERQARLTAGAFEQRLLLEEGRADGLALLQGVSDAFFEVSRLQQRAETSRARITAAREALRGAQGRFEQGTVPRGDVLTAESLVADAVADGELRNLQLANARAHLARLLGDDPLRTTPGARTPDEALTGVPPGESVDALVVRALATSPERARLVVARDAERARLEYVRQGRTVTVNAIGDLGYTYKDRAPGSGSGPFVRLGVTAELPVLGRDTVAQQVRVQEAEIRRRDALLEQFDAQLKEQVQALYAEVLSGNAQIESATAASAAAREAHRLAQERYSLGRGTQLEVFEALGRLGAAQDALTAALHRRAASAVKLRLLSGALTPPGRS